MSDSQPQAQPQQGSGGQQQPSLLRADDILKLQSLPDDEKQKYRLIMQNFWNMVQQNAPGSQEHTTARQKLAEWSAKFIARERQHRQKIKAQQQQQQQQQGGQSNQEQSSQPNAGQQPMIKPEAPQALNRPVENAQGPAAQNSQAQQNAPTNANQNRQQQHVDPSILKHVHEFPIEAPPGPAPGTPQYEAKVKEYRNGYLNMLVKQAGLVESRRKLNNTLQARQNNGQDVPQEMHDMKTKIEKEHAQIKDKLDKFRGLQKQWKEEREGKERGQGGPATQPPPGPNQNPPPQQIPQQQQPQQVQQLQRQGSQAGLNGQPQIKEEPQIKVEGGMPPSQPQAQFGMQGNPQQQQAQQNHQMPPQMPTQQQQQQHHPQQQQPRPPPAPHSQSMPPNQVPQQFQQGQQHPNFQQQQRPQINPMQANAHQHQQSNSPHPQSATGGGPPQALSHQAAVSAANRSYTDPQRTNTPMQPGGQGNFGSREREQLNNPKMPIPRHLTVNSPQAVHMGQARPTMSGPTNGAPGPMGQPVIPRPPPFQLEGEGDRVLSKRKLDELVRQVTGGSEEALTPEVEEVRQPYAHSITPFSAHTSLQPNAMY